MTYFIKSYGFIIVLLPLLGAVVNGFFGKRLRERFGGTASGYIASAMVFLSFLLSTAAFIVVAGSHGAAIVNHAYTWMSLGTLQVEIAFLFDPLSAMMLLIITGIGFLIHVYSTAYMHGDQGISRYFAYLNLFVFSMLILVLAENALLMFVGWEGVGLCSYLLIGFWFQEKQNTTAANKAFIVNRVGDFGFIAGLFLLYWFLAKAAGPSAGTSILSFSYLAEHAHLLKDATIFGASLATVICLALFLGATGKSAQIPLYVWLPDAMAGPTPVSALIHAATMVTAGVYMVGRLNFLFSMSHTAMAVIAVTGAGTALLAATMGCLQNDIKKVLAYSTVSQLGYMFLAMGVGAWSAGLFHVMTHAFFKACLFLGAGSVILGMHHEQDIRKMGGLRKHMPRTFATFALATAAIMGMPPLSGFFSKDEILWQAWSGEHGHPGLWFAGFLTAGITAFYMARLLFLTFFGETRRDAHHNHHDDHGEHAHDRVISESPAAITVPLIILAGFSAAAGLVGVPAALGGSNRIAEFLAPVLGHHGTAGTHDPIEYVLMAASVCAALAGGGLAYLFYLARPDIPVMLAERLGPVHRLVYNKYYIDEIYGALFVTGTKILSRVLALFDRHVIDLLVNVSGLALRTQARIAGWFDQAYVDGAVNLVADSTLSFGEQVRKLQTGRVQVYVLVLVCMVALGIVIRLMTV
ncbi:MAG: NADH-quinone oxidoreductase subunit L [Nitrospirota bacterium]|nr:NADH-quinone oxidoreductase subunit L [Nitrospirota bacterium]